MQVSPTEYWFIFINDNLVFIVNDNDHKLPDESFAQQVGEWFLRRYKLGEFNNITCYCAELAPAWSPPSNIAALPLRKAFPVLGHDWYNAAVKASSIINWDKNHQFCGRCGQSTQHKPNTFERICSACGLIQYPRISPSIIVLIKNGQQLLMARSPHFPPGVFGLIAGFVEPGESVEEAVHREVHEEVALQINNLRYVGSQSWPFPDSLMIGFTADYAAGEIKIDNNEIEAAAWYRYDNLPLGPTISFSIARRLIEHFVTEQQQIYSNGNKE